VDWLRQAEVEDLLLEAAQAIKDRAPVITPIQPRLTKR
jgi:hypothetical protein